MIEQFDGGYRPRSDGRCPDGSWEEQLGSLTTEQLLAIREQVQHLMDHVTAGRGPEQLRARELVRAAERLGQRLAHSRSLLESPGEVV